MRAQQGIGTILILIAVVLAGVIAAVLLIQTADQLRTKALTLQKEHEQMMIDRVMIKEVQGIVDTTKSPQCVKYILMKVMLAPGSNPLDLRKVIMSFVTTDIALQGIKYVPPEELYTYSESGDPEQGDLNYVNIIILDSNLYSDPVMLENPACRATLLNVMEKLNNYSIDYIAAVLDPFAPDTNNPKAGSFYTALWTDCYEKGDTTMLLPNQEILVFYRPKRCLLPSELFTVELGHAQGYSEVKKLMVPRGFEGKVVTIFP